MASHSTLYPQTLTEPSTVHYLQNELKKGGGERGEGKEREGGKARRRERGRMESGGREGGKEGKREGKKEGKKLGISFEGYCQHNFSLTPMPER